MSNKQKVLINHEEVKENGIYYIEHRRCSTTVQLIGLGNSWISIVVLSQSIGHEVWSAGEYKTLKRDECTFYILK